MPMSVNPSRRTSPAPARVQKRFEKTRSRMVYHAIKGAWGCFPNKPFFGLWARKTPLAILIATLLFFTGGCRIITKMDANRFNIVKKREEYCNGTGRIFKQI